MRFSNFHNVDEMCLYDMALFSVEKVSSSINFVTCVVGKNSKISLLLNIVLMFYHICSKHLL